MNKSLKLATALLALSITTIMQPVPKRPVAKATRIQEITTADELNNFLSAHQKAVVEFYNPTCPVCMAFAKKGIFPYLAKQYPDIGFATVSVEDGKKLHAKYEIPAYPTFVFLKDGTEIKRFSGYTDKEAFARRVSNIFASSAKTRGRK